MSEIPTDDIAKTLRAWAKAYRDTTEHRFPSDPHAEFFPLDMDAGATSIDALRARVAELEKALGKCLTAWDSLPPGSHGARTVNNWICSDEWKDAIESARAAHRLAQKGE